MRETGRPLLMRGPEVDKARSKIRAFNARGMSYAQMSRQTGLPWKTFATAVSPVRNLEYMRRSTFLKVAGLRYEEPSAVRSALLDSTGTRRRVGALWADGFPLAWLAEQLPSDRGYYQKIARGEKGAAGIQYSTMKSVSELYAKLDGVTPESMGIHPRSISRARTYAAKLHTPTRSCWDPDTIDDPEAIPEWTGACGTKSGPGIHKREKTRLCRACLEFKYKQRNELKERRKREQGGPEQHGRRGEA